MILPNNTIQVLTSQYNISSADNNTMSGITPNNTHYNAAIHPSNLTATLSTPLDGSPPLFPPRNYILIGFSFAILVCLGLWLLLKWYIESRRPVKAFETFCGVRMSVNTLGQDSLSDDEELHTEIEYDGISINTI
ncbi:hypothetical protein THOM_1178 [Trachipleistophora hominis]|uniref:Uncharacterized protein n=1 Tax=Trachipleistophora hominis TaxID=72359 RepID=L7JWQ8_TRAHO|nr:hypothetical protein THOM_1178 [Trachipleistophora hominis]